MRLAALVLLVPSAALAGELGGTIRFEGPPHDFKAVTIAKDAPVCGKQAANDLLVVAPDGGLANVVVALKDRIITEPAIDPAKEAADLEALFGAPLDGKASAVPDLEARARRFCGVLLASPQFLLGRLPTPDTPGPK